MAAEVMKPWQKGIPLARLKTLAEPFRLMHKPHVYGAFGLVKELAVAEALAEERLLYTMRGDRCVGAAILRRLKSASTQSDFAGREISIQRGAVSVSAFAAIDAEAADKILTAALARAGAMGAPDLWVEIFEEDVVAKAAVAPLLRYQASKVMAGSEIKGLYAVRGEGRDLADDAEDQTLAILASGFALPVDLSAIRAELAAFASWAQHYSGYNKGRSWTAFALRGYDPSDPTFIIKPGEMAAKWKDENAERIADPVGDTVAYSRFPVTRALVDLIRGEKDRVRFMRLDPGKGELTRHADITDREAGVRDGMVARLHIPISTNPAVRFSAWDKRGTPLATNFPEGALCYLDQRKPHAVVNAGETERIHLVVDVRSSPDLRALIGKARHAARPALVA